MAEPNDIIRSVVVAFNDKRDSFGYGERAFAYFPIKEDDITESHESSGGNGRAVVECRYLCIYIIARHCIVRDAYNGSDKLLSYAAIGDIFRRTKQAVNLSIKGCCRILQDPKYRAVYQAAIDNLSAQGIALFNTRVTRTECHE